MFCVNCGRQLDDSARFCPYCGTAVSAAPSAGDAAPQADSQSSFYQSGGGGAWQPDASRQSGFDPWNVGGAGGVNASSGGTNEKPRGDDPWTQSNGSACVAAAPAQKKRSPGKTAARVIAIAVAVVVAAFAVLAFIGSRIPDYELVLDDYFNAAEDADVSAIFALYPEDVYESCVEYYGAEVAPEILDGWTKYYGLEFSYYEVAEDTECPELLDNFNESFGLNATDYRDVAVNAYYENGTYNLLDFDLVEIDGNWYLVRTW